MTAFAEAPLDVHFPARYRDAVPGLRLRLFDPTENELPDWVESVEIGDQLRAVVTSSVFVVPVEMSRRWGVSMDELVATATEQVAAIPFERETLERDGVVIEVTRGHQWTSSLITQIDEVSAGPEGTIVGIPSCDVMLTAPVVGAETVDGLEMVMLFCDEVYKLSDGGISPHVWWSWNDGLYRITDRRPDGTIDIDPAANVSAFYLVRAIEHLAHPCDECAETGSP
ncbi:MAG: hypothetical protein V3S26_04730 [Acidimicrobiia bacterium]|jgi:hypothetical protein